jgi:hypothetical protein
MYVYLPVWRQWPQVAVVAVRVTTARDTASGVETGREFEVVCRVTTGGTPKAVNARSQIGCNNST